MCHVPSDRGQSLLFNSFYSLSFFSPDYPLHSLPTYSSLVKVSRRFRLSLKPPMNVKVSKSFFLNICLGNITCLFLILCISVLFFKIFLKNSSLTIYFVHGIFVFDRITFILNTLFVCQKTFQHSLLPEYTFLCLLSKFACIFNISFTFAESSSDITIQPWISVSQFTSSPLISYKYLFLL